MCESLATTISVLDYERDRIVYYIVCETCGNRREMFGEQYKPDPKLEMPASPGE